ncbi:hypothetical protein Gpo141_00007681 [Globisporangium polare]
MTSLRAHGLTVDELFAPQMRCSYPSKVCHNPRAFKLCGSLHKLCEFHRKKANLNQKRLQQRRRAIRAQMTAHCTSMDLEFYGAPAMQINLLDLLETEVPAMATATSLMASEDLFAPSSSSDEFSAFETSFLDSTVFGELSPANFVDQAPLLKFESVSFELRL